jgi:hypothetical protein
VRVAAGKPAARVEAWAAATRRGAARRGPARGGERRCGCWDGTWSNEESGAGAAGAWHMAGEGGGIGQRGKQREGDWR